MRKLFVIVVVVAACAMLLETLIVAGDRQRSEAADERAIRALIAEWVEAYTNSDAKRLAAHETTSVEVVDCFGRLRLPSSTSENEKLWSDTFEVISRSPLPTVSIDHISFLRPEIAVVQVSWQFSEGILLADGYRIPPFSQADTYVVTKAKDIWLVAAHNMQERKP